MIKFNNETVVRLILRLEFFLRCFERTFLTETFLAVLLIQNDFTECVLSMVAL